MKVCILTNILAPYRLPLFEAIKDQVEHLNIVLMARREKERHWKVDNFGFAAHFLPGLHFKPPGYPFSVHINYSVQEALKKLDPDVLISGGFAPANIAGYLYARKARKKHLVWGELHAQDLEQASWIKRLIRRKLISGSAGAIASSSRARDVFVHYGLSEDRVLTSVMPIDVGFFSDSAEAFRGSDEWCGLRRRYPSPLLLSIGRLTDSKGYWEIFQIYELLLKHHPEAGLLIAGDGPERQDYESHCRAKGWQGVHFLGFQSPAELIKFLTIADLFVFHSLRDPFGAVVPEAMAAGTLVVASIHAGATDDLVVEGETGFRIDPKDCEGTTRKIMHVLELPEDRRRQLVNNARQRVGRHTFSASAKEIVDFARSLEVGR
ncbi:MAG: glycosyltransferase family 4 protein [Syntrophotaleaceae bacterium]